MKADDSLPQIRGREGEENLRRVLKTTVGSAGYTTTSPLYLPTAEKGWAEIDALCIHPSGLYVFENKYMAGAVSGRLRDRMWTRTGETVLSFPNPVLQNRKHLLTAAEFFGITPKNAVSVIVFNDGCDISRIETDSRDLITGLSDLAAVLRPLFSHSPVFSADRLTSLSQKAAKAEAANAKAASEHLTAIREGKQRRRSDKKHGRKD